MSRFVGLYVQASGVKLEVSVNGVPLVTSEGEAMNQSELLNGWVVTGENSLEVRIGSPNDQHEHEGRNVSLLIRDMLLLEGPSDPGLMRYDWPNVDQRATELPARNPEATTKFVVPYDAFGPFEWLKGEEQEYSEALEGELVAAFAEIYQAFSTSDLSAIEKLSAVRTEEMAAAIGEEVQDYLAEMRADWEDSISHGMAEIVADDADLLKLVRCWDGRLYRVLSLDDEPALTTIADEDGLVMSYDVYLGRVANKWQWVR